MTCWLHVGDSAHFPQPKDQSQAGLSSVRCWQRLPPTLSLAPSPTYLPSNLNLNSSPNPNTSATPNLTLNLNLILTLTYIVVVNENRPHYAGANYEGNREQGAMLARSKWTAQVALVLRTAADDEDDAAGNQAAGARPHLCL